MKPLSKLTLQDIQNIKLVSFDADGVVIERGTKILEKDGLLTVNSKVISDVMLEKLSQLKKHFRINISSGRNLLYLNRMFGAVLWENASIQGEDGLFTLIDGQILQQSPLINEELQLLEEIKLKVGALSKNDTNIDGFEPKQFIISIHCKQPDPEVENIVKVLDKNNIIAINWVSDEGYDVYLKRFNKGNGIKFLCDHLNIQTNQVLAIGNDPNDRTMTDVAGIGVTTDEKHLNAHFYTEGKTSLGGEELVDRLLEIKNMSS